MNMERTIGPMEQGLIKLQNYKDTHPEAKFGLDVPCTPVRFDEENRTVDFAFQTEEWMSNPSGVVHGGAVAILLDNGMGLAAHSLYGRHNPTITMNINYQRPVPLNSTIIVRAKVVIFGRTVTHTSAELFLQDEPDRILVTATAVYSTKQK